LDHREIEWQFEATDLGFAESWLEHHSEGTGISVAPEGTEEISDTYYDTLDWRLHRAGYALRVRKSGSEVEATMKSLERSGAGDNVLRRREITEPVKDGKLATLVDAPGPVGARVRALLGNHEARPLFEVRNRRRTFALRLDDGSTAGGGESANGADGEVTQDASGDVRPRGGDSGVKIGVVTLDSTEIPLGEDGEAVSLNRVEVEAGEGTAPTPDLRGFVDELQFALGLNPTTYSKYEAGLYATGLAPISSEDLGGPSRVDAGMTVGEAAFAVLRGQFAELKAHEPGTRLGEDPEELHDMRVATRRMRAAIKLFEDALPERARWFREELRHIAASLGDVRDLDVQIGELEAQASGADSEEEREGLGKVVEILGKRREEARARMMETLNSARYELFKSSFAELLRRGPGADGALSRKDGHDPSRQPVTAAAPALVNKRHKKWRKAAGRIGEGSDAEAYHDLRKEGKRLRYALEFLSDLYGGATDGVVKPLKALQDDLGRHQDAVVSVGLLRQLGTNTDVPRISRAVAFTMGVYAERYGREAREVRAGLAASDPFKVLLKRGTWKALYGAMEKAEEKAAKARRKGSQAAV
jgi:CHAD domain-containing protein